MNITLDNYVTITVEQYKHLSNIVLDLDDIVIIYPYAGMNYWISPKEFGLNF